MKKSIIYLIISFLTSQIVISQAVWHQYQGPYSGNIWACTSKGDTLYCGAGENEIYHSIDYGHTWIETPAVMNGFINSLYFYGSKLFASWSSSTYISEDNGKSWNQFYNIVATNQFYLFKSKLFAGTDKGIFLYDSISNSWINKSTGLDPNDSDYISRNVRRITSVGNILFCATINKGIYSSKDTGETWESIPPSSGLTCDYILCMVNFNDTLFVPNGFDKKIYLSADTGKNWSSIGFNGLVVNDIAIYENNMYFATDQGIYKYKSIDSSWSLFKNESFNKIFIKDSIFLGSNSFGLYRWNKNIDSFILSNKGINTAQVYGMAIFNKSLYSATSSGAFYTPDDGKNWFLVNETKNIVCQTIAKIDTMLFIGTSNGIVATSLHANNWYHLDSGLTSKVIWNISQIDNMLLAATDLGLFKSIDAGKNWVHISGSSNQMLKIVHDNNMILIATNNGLYELSANRDSINLIGFKGDDISSIGLFNNLVYVSVGMGNYGMYKSSDSCKSWTKYSLPIVYDLSQRGDENLYASGMAQIYYSPDNGIHWETWSETGMPNFFIKCLIQSDSCFYAGTLGKSIYKREYLNLTDCSSHRYNINNSIISNVPINTNIDSIKSNLKLAHGASIEIIPNSSLKAGLNSVKTGDKVKIIAEDGITVKTYTIEIATGIATESMQQNFIFPNPAFSILNIKGVHSPKAAILIYDLQGKQVINKQIFSGQVDISNLSKGVYIVKLLDSGNVLVNKIVKE
jgi:hypothetical protein